MRHSEEIKEVKCHSISSDEVTSVYVYVYKYISVCIFIQVHVYVHLFR